MPQALCLLLFGLLPPAAGLEVAEARPDEAMNALFTRTEGWIGGDGAYSIAGPDGRRLWLFSDTWVGKVAEGRRKEATIVNNTLAVQTGSGAAARVEFVVGKNREGKPAAFIRPEGDKSWFWLNGGVRAGGRLHFFPAEMERTEAKGVFGFRQVGQWLATVANPDDPPLEWKITRQRLPFADFTPKGERTFGAAVMLHEGQVYVYGYRQSPGWPFPERSAVVARARESALADLDVWEFHGPNGWCKEAALAQPLFGGAATEYSVDYLPKRKQFVAVYTELGLSDRIMARTAPTPIGPWSAAVLLYRCPEMARDKRVFSYAAKAHGGLAGDDELLISYVVNSFDFWQVAREAWLYWPRFVRVKLAPAGS